MAEQKLVYLRSLNPLITCFLCDGYLIDATTIPECLHTFCKSCILKHLQENTQCPTCGNVIHQSHPTQYISYDRTMQDIVYKLVPNLFKEEMRRREEFCKQRGIPFDNPLNSTIEENDKPSPNSVNDHSNDEPVALVLNSISSTTVNLACKYIIVSVQATITQLKKYIAIKLFNDIERFREVDVLCNNELMGKDHSLKFILRTRWRTKSPLELQYREHIDI